MSVSRLCRKLARVDNRSNSPHTNAHIHTNSNVSYLHNPTAQRCNAYILNLAESNEVCLRRIYVVHLVHLDAVVLEAEVLTIDSINLVH